MYNVLHTFHGLETAQWVQSIFKTSAEKDFACKKVFNKKNQS